MLSHTKRAPKSLKTSRAPIVNIIKSTDWGHCYVLDIIGAWRACDSITDMFIVTLVKF